MKKITLLFLILSIACLAIAQGLNSKNGIAIVNNEHQQMNIYQKNQDSIFPPFDNLQPTSQTIQPQRATQAAISKSVVITAGSLSTTLTNDELNTVTNLTITGAIDARDFKTMRDYMPILAILDISGADISAYTGTEGTYSTSNITYPVNEIPADAFYNYGTKLGKTSLVSISLPLSATSIGNYAFQNSILPSINITSNIKTIGNYAFYSCYNLTSVTIPSSVISMGNYAFSYCNSLTSLFIPSTVTSIGTNAFLGSSATLSVDVNNTNFSGQDGILFNKDKSTLIQCPVSKTGNYEIPSMVSTLKDYCFGMCNKLTSVTIPSTVTTINSSAFNNCSSLTSIYALATTPVNLASSSNVFYNVNKTACTLFVLSSSILLYSQSVQWKDFTNIVDKDLIFLVGTKSLNLTAISSITTVSLTINTSWSASSDQSWLTVSPGTGSGNATLTLTAEANQTSMTRSANVKILTSGGVSQTISINQKGQPKSISIAAGGLYLALSMNERKTITNLSVSGTIDARDFRILRDSLPLLSDLNLDAVTIQAYTGTEGTYSTSNIVYPANEIPADAFYNATTYTGKKSLISITMPLTASSIGNYAFENCSGLSGSFKIPSSVTNIGNYALSYCTGITEVIIPDAVTSIGTSAFFGCSGITGITIPNSVSSLGTAVFGNCINLTGITVHAENPVFSGLNGVLFNKNQSSLVEYPGGKIGSYSIPATVSSIAGSAFYFCTGLTTISIPGSVTTIGSYAFYYCTGLKSMTIPSTVLSIGTYAFGYCTGLSSINTNAKPLDLTTSPNVFYSINKSTSILNVPYNSKYLYQSANQWKDFMNIVENTQGFLLGTNNVTFDANTSNYNVSIDANIVWNAISDKTWLTVNPGSGNTNNSLILSAQANLTNATRIASVTVSAAGVVSQVITVTQNGLPKTTFVTAGSLASILTTDELNGISELTLTGTVDARDFKTLRDNMPVLSKLDLSGVMVTAYTGTEGTAGKTIITYPDNTIPDYAFSLPITYAGKTSLKSILFPNNITAIGYTAFENCSGLTGTLSIPSTVTSIGNYAFSYCTGFTGTINLPSMLNSIGDAAFLSCSGFTGQLTIPSSVTSIGASSFGICSGLTSVTIPASVLKIGDYAFRRCIGLISVESNNPNYLSFDGVLFDKNQSVLMHYPISKTGSYVIPSTVKTIAIGAFDNCILNSVTIPSSVTTIGGSAFYNCSNLTALSIGNSVTTIETYAFYFCSGLTSLSIPSSVKSIGSYAFYFCSGLVTLSIPASVTSIGSYAFCNCLGLNSIYTYSPVPVDLSLSNYVFNGVNKTTCTLNVPRNSKTAYQSANQWKDFLVMSEFDNTAVPVLLEGGIRIYPNPVIDVLRISGINGSATLKLIDVNGRVLFNRQVTNDEPVSVNSLPQGFYILKLSTTEGTVERKIIKR